KIPIRASEIAVDKWEGLQQRMLLVLVAALTNHAADRVHQSLYSEWFDQQRLRPFDQRISHSVVAAHHRQDDRRRQLATEIANAPADTGAVLAVRQVDVDENQRGLGVGGAGVEVRSVSIEGPDVE